MAASTNYEETKSALERMQVFDVSTLGREADLGKQLNFTSAIEGARNIVGIYKRIPLSSLDDFTDSQLNTIKSNSQSDFQLFEQILKFDTTVADVSNARTNIISTISSRRNTLFDQVWQFIAYGVARNTDTSVIEANARASIQSIEDQSNAILKKLNTAETEADNALKAIRAAALEQGVSQQAVYFKQESEDQNSLADTWLRRTLYAASGVGLFAIFSLFLHKIEWIKPTDTAEMIQLISSKILIFAVLGYLLILSARNYMTHKHNAVVNKHRQNALLTYRALVEASTSKGVEDIVLANAASCIFAPQETGFSSSKGDFSSGTKSVLELMTKGVSESN